MMVPGGFIHGDGQNLRPRGLFASRGQMGNRIMEFLEKTLSSQMVFQGKIVTVSADRVLLPDGRQTGRELVRHPGGVCIVAADKDELMMVRQFRYPFGAELLELPAGKLEPGEDPAECGLRELREETGYAAGRFEPFGVFYPSPGYLSEVIYFYLAGELRFVGQQLDPNEFLRVERVHWRQAVEMALEGKIPDGKTQTALLKYAALRGGEAPGANQKPKT
jgi:ADP-ribose pyrophosphatase